MIIKKCKDISCKKEVWRTGSFSYSDYCWEHDPEVQASMNKTICIICHGKHRKSECPSK